jgi:hypothetical protein
MRSAYGRKHKKNGGSLVMTHPAGSQCITTENHGFSLGGMISDMSHVLSTNVHTFTLVVFYGDKY